MLQGLTLIQDSKRKWNRIDENCVRITKTFNTRHSKRPDRYLIAYATYISCWRDDRTKVLQFIRYMLQGNKENKKCYLMLQNLCRTLAYKDSFFINAILWKKIRPHNHGSGSQRKTKNKRIRPLTSSIKKRYAYMYSLFSWYIVLGVYLYMKM